MKKFRNRYLTLILILGVNSILINYLSFDKNTDVQAELQAIQHIPVNLKAGEVKIFCLKKKFTKYWKLSPSFTENMCLMKDTKSFYQSFIIQKQKLIFMHQKVV